MIEAVGLAGMALTTSAPVAVVALVVKAVGQGFAVPSLGLLALASVPPSRHGRTAGAFFAYFDAGVGLGGPAVGLAARAADPTGGLLAAAGAVLATAPVVLLAPRVRAGTPAPRLVSRRDGRALDGLSQRRGRSAPAGAPGHGALGPANPAARGAPPTLWACRSRGAASPTGSHVRALAVPAPGERRRNDPHTCPNPRSPHAEGPRVDI